jgi:pSer/pThr/pTyr-binding forkhead associated (FHA) protein
LVPITPATWPGTPPPSSGSKPSQRFWLVLNGKRITLKQGEVLIGRSPSCQVCLDDMLVSRRHARVLVGTDAVFIEDAESTNGVVVNDAPISGATRLEDGDRVLIGTTELVLGSGPDLESSVTSDSAVSSIAAASSGRRPIAPVPLRATVPSGAVESERAVHTEKVDGLATMARLADRMITMGRQDAAARLLGDHMRTILLAARQGKNIPYDVLDTVGHYGMKLADLTKDGAFANIALEVHLACRRPLPIKAIQLLETLIGKVPLDRQILLAYKAVLRDVSPIFCKADQDIVERILKLPSR